MLDGVVGPETLVAQARALSQSQRLIIHHAPHSLARTLAIGWPEHPRLAIAIE